MPKEKEKTTVRKNIDVDAVTVKIIAKEAIDKGTNFKNLSETILKDHAILINKLQSEALKKCAEEALKTM